MKKQLFISTTLIMIAGLLSLFFASVYIAHRNNVNIATNTVMEKTYIFANLFNDIYDVDAFVEAGGDTRITIISSDGMVLADSLATEDTGENRLSRPEIQAAMNGAPAVHIRHSNTFDADFVYYALMVDNDDSYVFIRASIPVAQINVYLNQALPMLIVLLFTIILVCLFLAHVVTNRIIKPFIAKGIDDVAVVMQNGVDALREEKNKLSYILNSIGDGLFVVDENADIALVNLAATNLFNATSDVINRKLNYLISNKTLISAVEDCVISSNGTLFEFPLNGKTYLVTIKRLPNTTLTMAVLADVTGSRENAKRREEFFANASHELKTPLTAIKGFNELTAINNNDTNLTKYIDAITRETTRMMALIADMLELSELENTSQVQPASISLAKIVNEVSETLSSAINEKSIIFTATGDATITAEPKHLFEITKNLVENSVRYSNQNGKVTVKIESGKTVRLTVSDNGIGISPQEQTKIFERFYRVEKSRSSQSGGTGLGLSIVKHICALYCWRLSLKSKLGVGTDVMVEFE